MAYFFHISKKAFIPKIDNKIGWKILQFFYKTAELLKCINSNVFVTSTTKMHNFKLIKSKDGYTQNIKKNLQVMHTEI